MTSLLRPFSLVAPGSLPGRLLVLGCSVGGLLSGLAGCKETTSSRNIRTGGIAMLTEVTARSEDASRVRTELLVGGNESNTYVILDSGDRMYAEADGERVEMEAVDDGVYEADFDLGAEDVEFRIILDREEDETADGNVGTLPAPFDITSDLGSDALSRKDDDVVITWAPSGSDDDMEFEVDDDTGGCIFSDSQDIAGDEGEYTIDKGTLDSTSSQDPETCDVTATLERSRSGSTDTALDSESRIVLRQVRSTTFASAP